MAVEAPTCRESLKITFFCGSVVFVVSVVDHRFSVLIKNLFRDVVLWSPRSLTLPRGGRESRGSRVVGFLGLRKD